MEKTKKIKIYLALAYAVIILAFLLVFFNNFSLSEITTYDFLKNNRDYLIQLKNSNILFISIIFLLFTIVWVAFLLGFGSPIALLGGFIFGKWTGTFLVTFGISFGATLHYVFANYFLKDFVREKFSKKFNFFHLKFKKNEFVFFLIYRFVGGIPLAISNIIPCLFNVSLKNFFFGTLLGMTPQLFIAVSLGSGLEKIIDKNIKAPTFSELFFAPEIYIPLLGFISLLILGIILKNIFYKN